jgi:hypothetical protein
MEIKYQGTVLLNHGYMDIGEFDIEPEGDLNLDGRGNSAMNGPGVGSGSSGASYGALPPPPEPWPLPPLTVILP